MWLLLIPAWVLLWVIIFIYEACIISHNQKYIDYLDEKYSSDDIVYYNNEGCSYKQKYYLLSSILGKNEDHDYTRISLISDKYIVYCNLDNGKISYFIITPNGEKRLITTDHGFDGFFVAYDNLYFKYKDEYYQYDITNENMIKILSNEYLNNSFTRYSYEKYKSEIIIEDRLNYNRKKISIKYLCQNPDFLKFQTKIKMELFSNCEFKYIFEFENSIFIVVTMRNHSNCITLKFEFDSGEFEIYDVYKFKGYDHADSAFHLIDNKSIILEYLIENNDISVE